MRGRPILADDPRKEYRPSDWYSRQALDAPGASNKKTLFFLLESLLMEAIRMTTAKIV